MDNSTKGKVVPFRKKFKSIEDRDEDFWEKIKRVNNHLKQKRAQDRAKQNRSVTSAWKLGKKK